MLDSLAEFVPASQAELQRFVQENDAGDRQALYPVGGRTSLNFGRPATRSGTLVSLAQLTQVVDYPSRDMTITVEAGIRMDELAQRLRDEGQQLAVDVSQSNRASLGGVVATDSSGPRRFGLGTMRDYVIGISAIDAGGRLFHAGGRVVKNVAGYDLCKLLVGSLGSLAIITQLTLKLRPLAESTVMLWVPFGTYADIEAVLSDLLTSETRPIVLDVLNSAAARQIAAESRQELPCDSPVVIIGLEGTERETNWQVDQLNGELRRHQPGSIELATDGSAARLLQAMTEYQTASDAPATFEASLLPSETVEFIELASSHGLAIQSHVGDGCVIGHLPDHTSTVEQAAEILRPLRQTARRAGGNLKLLDCEADWSAYLPILGDDEPSWPLMQKLKETLDPHDVLNPDRFVFAGQS